MPKTPLDLVEERIEQRMPDAGKARWLLYDRILADLDHTRRKKLGDGTNPLEILRWVREAVVRAYAEQDRLAQESAAEPLRARYWAERERLKRDIRAISLSPLIMPFSHLIKFREIDAVFCKHDRYRANCVWMRQMLERLRAVPSDARTRRFLTALRIDPEKARPEEFCEPPGLPEIVAEIVAESASPPRPVRRSRGRPPDPVIDKFVATAAAILQIHGGLNEEPSFAFAAELVGACLGGEVDPESKLRQARRRRQRARSPKAS